MRNYRGKAGLKVSKAIFLDRDGTINVEKHYLHKIEDFEFLPGVIEGLKLLQEAGYLLIVITNQSGIARGYYTEEDFHKLNDWMIEKLNESGVKISKVYFCPHLPDANIEKYRIECECRKPKLGMYKTAIKEFDIDLDESWAIGDKIRDLAICEKTGCEGFLVGENENENTLQRIKTKQIRNISYCENLLLSANEIISNKQMSR